MAPSDPDFPFDILALDCVLHIPAAYPKEGKPSLDVRNKEMGRGFQINVERGFARLAGTLTRSTLLGLMNALDKQLESLLTEQKAETITFVSNNASGTMAQQIGSIKPAEEVKTTTTNISRESKPQTIYTAEQRLIASERRERETRQLEARMGRLPLFSKSTDGIAYTIPITPREQASLPVPLQAVKTVKLFVPLLYPLQRCRIEILDVPRKAAMNTEKGFEKKVQDNSDTSLLGHVNYLAQNMRVLATEFSVEIVEEKDDLPGVSSLKVVDTAAQTHVDLAIPGKEERSHIKIIPRPPEWTSRPDDEASSGSEYSDSYDSGDEDEEDGGTALDTIEEKNTATAPERGISLSFPFLELYSIELLELVSLYLTIKCERCKDTMDISNLQTNVPRSETCSKCALHFSVVYRKELMHLNSVRAGYLDLDGCTVVDMLPRST